MAENQVAESKIITINSANAQRLNGSNLSNIVFNFQDVVKTVTETTHTISLQSVCCVISKPYGMVRYLVNM